LVKSYLKKPIETERECPRILVYFLFVATKTMREAQNKYTIIEVDAIQNFHRAFFSNTHNIIGTIINEPYVLRTTYVMKSN